MARTRTVESNVMILSACRSSPRSAGGRSVRPQDFGDVLVDDLPGVKPLIFIAAMHYGPQSCWTPRHFCNKNPKLTPGRCGDLEGRTEHSATSQLWWSGGALVVSASGSGDVAPAMATHQSPG